MADPISAAYMQFVTSTVFSSDVAELGSVLPKFDPMRNYKESAPVFESVRPGDGYYQEAQYLLTMCEVSKSILEPNRSIGSSISPSIARKAIAACEAISRNKSDEAYRNFMLYAIMCQVKLHSSWADLETHMLQSFTTRYNEINVQSRRLYAAGINGNQVTSKARGAMNDVAAMRSKLDDTDKGVKDYIARTFLALVENLRNPDAHDKEILELLPKYANAYESFGVPASFNLNARTAEALDRNRAAYRRSPAYRSVVRQWWDERSEVKSRLESQLKEQQEAARQAGTRTESARKKLNEAQLAQKEAMSPHLAVVAGIEAEIEEAETELKGLGLFKGKRKRELRELIAAKQEELAAAKSDLEGVTAEHDKLVDAAKSQLRSCERTEQSAKKTLDSTKKRLEDPDIPQTYIAKHLH